MEFTAKQISDLLGGKVEGNADVKVNTLSKIEEGVPGSLSFLHDGKYAKYLYNTKASVVIVSSDLVQDEPVSATLIRVPDARESFAKLLEIYNQIQLNRKGIEQPSFIAPSAKLGSDCYVGAFAYIGNNVKIGNNVNYSPYSCIFS